jgi:hypothetical protein
VLVRGEAQLRVADVVGGQLAEDVLDAQRERLRRLQQAQVPGGPGQEGGQALQAPGRHELLGKPPGGEPRLQLAGRGERQAAVQVEMQLDLGQLPDLGRHRFHGGEGNGTGRRTWAEPEWFSSGAAMFLTLTQLGMPNLISTQVQNREVGLPPLSGFHPRSFSLTQIGDGSHAISLLQQAGLL